MEHVPAEKQAYYEELSGIYSPIDEMANLAQPEGPGNTYGGGEVASLMWDSMSNYAADISRGERIFEAALCSTCHRMNGEGGNSGPDLSQVHTRFNRYELIFAITSPNDEISDQYAFTLFHLKDDKKIAGKILSEDDEKVVILPNPYSTVNTVEIAKSDILKRDLSPVSPMPPGLLNRLNDGEILDLLVYLNSGGDPEHELYNPDLQ